jgi:hypothetical protein
MWIFELAKEEPAGFTSALIIVIGFTGLISLAHFTDLFPVLWGPGFIANLSLLNSVYVCFALFTAVGIGIGLLAIVYDKSREKKQRAARATHGFYKYADGRIVQIYVQPNVQPKGDKSVRDCSTSMIYTDPNSSPKPPEPPKDERELSDFEQF